MKYYIISLEEVLAGVEFKSCFIVQATEDTVDDKILNVMKSWRGDVEFDTDAETYEYGDVLVTVSGIKEISNDTAQELINNYIVSLID